MQPCVQDGAGAADQCRTSPASSTRRASAPAAKRRAPASGLRSRPSRAPTSFTTRRCSRTIRSASRSTVRTPARARSHSQGTALYFVTTSQPIAVQFDVLFDGYQTTETIPYTPGVIGVQTVGWYRTGLDPTVRHYFKASPSARNVASSTGVQPFFDIDYFLCARLSSCADCEATRCRSSPTTRPRTRARRRALSLRQSAPSPAASAEA